MKKEYKDLEVEVVTFDDIITASGGCDTDHFACMCYDDATGCGGDEQATCAPDCDKILA